MKAVDCGSKEGGLWFGNIELKSAKLAAFRKPRLSGNFELDPIVLLEVELVSIVSLWNFELGPIVSLKVE